MHLLLRVGLQGDITKHRGLACGDEVDWLRANLSFAPGSIEGNLGPTLNVVRGVRCMCKFGIFVADDMKRV